MKLSNINGALARVSELSALREALKTLSGKSHVNAQRPLKVEIADHSGIASKELQQIGLSLADEIRPMAVSLINKRIIEISGELAALGFEDDTDSEAV